MAEATPSLDSVMPPACGYGLEERGSLQPKEESAGYNKLSFHEGLPLKVSSGDDQVAIDGYRKKSAGAR